jgi:hypothetical protein
MPLFSQLLAKAGKRLLMHIFQMFLLICLASLASDGASADTSSVRFSSKSILGFFEREDDKGKNVSVVPLYEYLGIDYGDPEEQSVTLHVYGWLRADMGDQNYYEDDTDGELLYGYVDYISPGDGLNVKLGRQHIFSGVINDSLDGIGVTAHLGPHLSFLAFGGYPVAFAEGNGSSGDGMAGGRFALHPTLADEIGFSYKNISDDNDTVENTAGMDLSLGLFNDWTVYGRSSWNVETSGWKEHAYEAAIILSRFYLKPFYQHVRYEDYFSGEESGVQPFRFLEESEEKLTIIGSDVIWQVLSRIDLGAKFKHYDYEIRSETSYYGAALVNVYGDRETAGGLEAGTMDGDAGENRYRLFRGFFFWDTPSPVFEEWFISGDVVYVLYEKEIYGRDHSLFVSMGTGKQLMEDLFRIEISGSYSTDPYFDSDFRLMMAITFELK